jgi:putative transcriptional regulator
MQHDTSERPSLFNRLKAGLEDGIAHAKGEKVLRTTELSIPDTPPDYTAERIRSIRTARKMSQYHFSLLLNVSCKTVQGWEQGLRRPSQSAARLLQVIENPDLLTTMLNSR